MKADVEKDWKMAEKAQNWRELFAVLEERESTRRSMQGQRMREINRKLNHTRPKVVKVRPANLGLGFGGFKEATHSKVNQQIEMQVRGIKEPPKQDKPKQAPTTAQQQTTSSSSALPSVQDLFQDASWRRGRRKQKVKRKVIPYTELLQSADAADTKNVIVDMRGPQSSLADDTRGRAPVTPRTPGEYRSNSSLPDGLAAGAGGRH